MKMCSLIVLKTDSKANFCLTTDFRSIKSAKKKNSWLMPSLDSEMQDFKAARVLPQSILRRVNGILLLFTYQMENIKA